MRISLNWLSEYISLPFSPRELDDRLTMLGIEVESIENPAEKMKKVVVGEVLEVTPHPNADKLRLTRVNIGTGEPLRIVCGAPNVRTGLKVAVATIGADLGEGFIIKKSKIRGEVSEGMLCSERELGLSDKHEGIWELPIEVVVGAPLAEAVGKDDVVMEIGITPNRADCLSHFGIAREVHAITGNPLRTPEVSISKVGGAIDSAIKIKLLDTTACPRYAARLVRGVKVGPSPDWLKRKIEAVGLRPINNIVDITNFVLMECGHPLHAFDFATVRSGTVVVRTAEGFATEYKTLDGKVRKLPPSALLITDGEQPLGIAGIMGGESSEITETTTDVLIESAYFNPASIRSTAKALGLSSDASYRFERGTDINVLPYAVERAVQLIVELAGGTAVEGMIDEYPAKRLLPTFRFRPARANALLGTDISPEVMRSVFAKLYIGVEELSETEWQLTSPSYRVDLEREEDAIEEIARIVGYDSIPSSSFEHAPLTGSREPLRVREHDEILRQTLFALGATECVSTPMVSEKDAQAFTDMPVEVVNPLNIEKNRMRSSVAINLLDAAQRNERFGADSLRLFEIGTVFSYTNSAIKGEVRLGRVREHSEAGLLISGIQEAKSPYNAQPLKADIFLLRGMVEAVVGRAGIREAAITAIETPEAELSSWPRAASYLNTGMAMKVAVGGKLIGLFGRVSSAISKQYDLRNDTYIALFDNNELHRLARESRVRPKAVTALPKYPAVERDLAIVLSRDIFASEVERVIRVAAASELLRSVRVFDEFQSPEMKAAGERSLAFHLLFRAEDHTLEEREVDDLIILILKRLESELHARLRA